MNDNILDRVRALDPVPGDPPDRAWTPAVVLDEVEHRSTMAPAGDRLQRAQPPRRPQWALAAAALLVVLAVGALVYVLASGQEGADVVEPTPTTLGAPAIPLELAEQWRQRFGSGDITGYEAIQAPDATFMCSPCGIWPSFEEQPYAQASSFWARVSAFLYVADGSLDGACVGTSPATARCEVSLDTGSLSVEGGTPVTMSIVFSIAKDAIAAVAIEDVSSGQEFSVTAIERYARWVEANHPDEYGALIVDVSGGGTMSYDLNVASQAQRDRNRELVAEWVEAGSPDAP